MSAGRSSWLCQGTMPPGCTTSLRRRKLAAGERDLLLGRDRSWPSTSSVTSFGFISPGLRDAGARSCRPGTAGERRRARDEDEGAEGEAGGGEKPAAFRDGRHGSISDELGSLSCGSAGASIGGAAARWKCRSGVALIARRYGGGVCHLRRRRYRPTMRRNGPADARAGVQRWRCTRSAISSRSAEELNFTRAAERCNVAQPSLTRAIKLLEEELGGPLFHRERANTHLSELGRMVKPHLEQVYEQAQEAKRQALDFIKLEEDGPQARRDVHDRAGPARRPGHAPSRAAIPAIELEIVDVERRGAARSG